MMNEGSFLGLMDCARARPAAGIAAGIDDVTMEKCPYHIPDRLEVVAAVELLAS